MKTLFGEGCERRDTGEVRCSQSEGATDRLQIGVPWTISKHKVPQFADKCSIIGNEGNMKQAR